MATLKRWSRFAIPPSVAVDLAETVGRYGRLVIERDPDGVLVLTARDAAVLREITRSKKVAGLLLDRRGGPGLAEGTGFVVQPWARGELKQELLNLGWPAEDLAGYTPGTPHDIGLALHEGEPGAWQLRPYQEDAVGSFLKHGSGVVVLPCGAGKTLVGAAAMAEVAATTLILVTNTVSARQWRSELLRRTTLTEDEIGEYSGQLKELKPSPSPPTRS